jgi:exopolysaccharide biosynthesis polyprenyl glycosylphosphotransferase
MTGGCGDTWRWMADEFTVQRGHAHAPAPAPAVGRAGHTDAGDSDAHHGSVPSLAALTGRRRRRWVRRFALALGDVVAITSGFVVASAVAGVPAADSKEIVILFGVWLPVCLIAFGAVGLYGQDDSRINHGTLDELPSVARTVALLAGSFLVLVWATGVAVPQVGLAFALWIIVTVMVISLRVLVRALLRRKPAMRQKTVIVGAGTVGQLLGHKLSVHREYGLELLGFVDGMPTVRREDLGDLALLGAVSDLQRLVRELGVDRVIIAFSNDSAEEMMAIIRMLKDYEVDIHIVPRLFDVIPPTAASDTIEGIPLIFLQRLRLSRTTRLLKRSFDLCITIALLIPLAPVFAVVAIVVKLDSPGPVFFRQIRMGLGDRTFRIFKFRTMTDGADERKAQIAHLNRHAQPGYDPRMFKVVNDPRVTRVGAFLRRTSLDELPQLFNVLRGEMSLIGPRPLILEEDSHVGSWGRTRLALKPGMTGLWQVSGRSSIPFDEMVKLDYLYVTSWSLANDCRLLLKTIPLVFRGDSNGG